MDAASVSGVVHVVRVAYCLTPELRAKFKEPFGMLVRGSFAETMHVLGNIVERERPPVVVAVGDTVSQNICASGMSVNLVITDGLRERKHVAPLVFTGRRVVHVRNPAGMITEEAIVAVREALGSSEQVHLVVSGEDDLLTVVAVAYAPLGGIVVYGQPGEGVVVVRVTADKQAEALGILKEMEVVRKAK
ncbi:MAG: DUF359 domain-containing protein [Candidatus Bathyarchaeia archaeon]